MDKIHKLLLELGATKTQFIWDARPLDASGLQDGYYYKFGPKPFNAYFNQFGHFCMQTSTGNYRYRLEEPFVVVLGEGPILCLWTWDEVEAMIQATIRE